MLWIDLLNILLIFFKSKFIKYSDRYMSDYYSKCEQTHHGHMVQIVWHIILLRFHEIISINNNNDNNYNNNNKYNNTIITIIQ